MRCLTNLLRPLKPGANRLAVAVQKFPLDVFVQPAMDGWAVFRAPPAPDPLRTGADGEAVPWRQTSNGEEKGAARIGRFAHKIGGDEGLVQIIHHAGHGEHCIDVARKNKQWVGTLRVVEGPRTDCIARAEQQLPVHIPHRESIVTIQVFRAVFPQRS